jgi:hypothetical protein
MGAYASAKMLSLGTKPLGLFDQNKLRQLLKTVLPERSDYIDKHGAGSYHYLLEELEQKLLAELLKGFEGAEADKEKVQQAHQIMELVSNRPRAVRY